ncbi:MAG: hypothetical protein U0176_14155 [Bacteroidia bacterium]
MNATAIKVYSMQWLSDFQELRLVSAMKLYRIVGPLIVGIEFDSRPASDNYQVFVTMYGLWQEDIRYCLRYPIIFEGLVDQRGLQIFLGDRDHSTRFEDARRSLRESFGHLVEGSLELGDALRYCDQYIAGNQLSSSPNSYRVAHVLQEEISLCLAVSSIGRAEEIYRKVKDTDWDNNNFRAFKTSVSEWSDKIERQMGDPETIRANVQLNRNNPKLKHLLVSELAMS